VRRDDTLRVNQEYLNSRIRELDLKQSWIADRLLIHRRTVSRWMTGKTPRISRTNAAALVTLLECDPRRLFPIDETQPMDSIALKRAALEALLDEDLLHIASPRGKWQLVERIVRANLYADIPLDLLGRVYNVLSISLWRQGRFDEARDIAEKARDIGARIEDPRTEGKALFNLGTIASLQNEHAGARQHYEMIIQPEQAFPKERDLASYWNNVAMLYRDMAEFDRSFVLISSAVDLFERNCLLFNAAIAHHCRAIVLTETGRLAEALSDVDRAIELANRSDFKSGQQSIPLFKADVLLLSGEIESARALVDRHKDVIDTPGFRDIQEHEILARFYRVVGELDHAARFIRAGIERTGGKSLERGLLLQEKSRFHREAGVGAEARAAVDSANRLFQSTGLVKRTCAYPLPEYGMCFARPA